MIETMTLNTHSGAVVPGMSPDTDSPKDAKVPKLLPGHKNTTGSSQASKMIKLKVEAFSDPKYNTIDEVVIKIMKMLEQHLKSNADDQTTAVQKFLAEQDDCVLWQLLLDAVSIDRADKEAVNARMYLSVMLIEMKPYLAFENLHDETSKRLYVKKCKTPEVHRKNLRKPKSTPFHIAAKNGHSKAIAAMIRHGKRFYDRTQSFDNNTTQSYTEHIPPREKDTLQECLERPDPDSSNHDTALVLASMAGDPSLETLGELLGAECIVNLLNTDATVFDKALNDGLLPVVDKILGVEPLVDMFVTRGSILRALANLQNTKSQKGPAAPKEHRMGILLSLVKRVKKEDVFDTNVTEAIIKNGLKEVWEAKSENILSSDVERSLLHLAVLHQKPEFVKLFVDSRRYAKSVAQMQSLPGPGRKQVLRYPLWYNNYDWDHKNAEWVRRAETSPVIRDMIVTRMIHEVDHMETLLDIFHHSEVRDLCFDLSRFNSAAFRVSHFVESLIHHKGSQDLLSYEETLRYAEFPSLDLLVGDRETFRESRHLDHEHYEVFTILEWLYERMKVKTIISLKVPDRLINPHDENEIANQVHRFRVEVLDWKVLDLSLECFSHEAKERISELHLYSSGKGAVISHWFSINGIPQFKNLKTLSIKVVQQCEAAIRKIRKLLRSLPEDSNKFFQELRDGDVDSTAWYPAPKLANLSQIAHLAAPKLAQWLGNLDTLVGEKREDTSLVRTKVAVLDNGIMSVSPTSPAAYNATWSSAYGREKTNSSTEETDKADQKDEKSLWKRIKEGRSFVDGDSRLSPWLFASNPHGTQMANLICAIDPFCELYIARVAEDAFGITPKRVAKAIAWARSKKVDVISMSFVLGESSDEMENEINLAEKEGIVMICSSHDEGYRLTTAYPASLRNPSKPLIVVAACDEYGKILREMKDDSNQNIDWLIRGRDVAAGVIPFLQSNGTITGSSASTALGAGLCSLILTCDRLANPGKRYAGKRETGSRYKMIQGHVEKMFSVNGGNFVLLEKFGGIDEPRIADSVNYDGSGRTRGPSARSVLDRKFKVPPVS